MSLPVQDVALVILVAALYLLLLRLIDLNEKEPLWLLGLFLGLGTLVGLLVHLVVPSTALYLDLLGGTATLELSRFVAIALGIALVTVVEGWRGWREIDGVVDGVVLGAAAGLGLAIGGLLIELAGELEVLVLPVNELTRLGIVGLHGLSGGLFGAIIGAGFAWSKSRRPDPSVGWLGGAIGVVVAMVAHLLFRLLTEPAIGSGTPGLVRVWIGLLVPLVLVIIAIGYGLTRERRAIASELADEPSDVVTEGELTVLQRPLWRRWHHLSQFWRGRFDDWATERRLNGLQVTLALLKSRASPSRRNLDNEQEVNRVRAAIRGVRAARTDGSQGQAAVGVRDD